MTEQDKIKELEADCGVYLIVSPSNGRYIGSSKSLKKRFNRYKNYSCNGQPALLASLKKYGFDNHQISILIYCKPEERLIWERIFGDMYLSSASFKDGLNIHLPSNGEVPSHRTEEYRKKVSISQKNRFSDIGQRNKLAKKSKEYYSNAEVRKKHSEELKKVYENPELRQQKSLLQKQYFSSKDARIKASNATKKFLLENPEAAKQNYSALINYYNSNPDVRSRIQKEWRDKKPSVAKAHSEYMKEFYKNNPELRKKVSEATKIQFQTNHPRAKKIIDTETGEIFKSSIQVSERINRPKQTVRNWLEGISKNPTSYKYL